MLKSSNEHIEKLNELQKIIEDLKSENKNLKNEINSLKKEINLLKDDNQAKDFKIAFFEKKLTLQDDHIRFLKSSSITPYINKKNQIEKEESIKKQILEEVNKNKIMDFKFKKDITSNAADYITLTQTFCVFKSLKGQTLLCWFTRKRPKRTIEIYDLEKEIIIKSINNPHTNDVHCCRHFIDTKNNSDLLITCSYDRSIKIWNIDNLESSILTIENAHSNGFIFSPCILSHQYLNENYIISGADDEFIKIFDFKGNVYQNYIKMDEYINFLDTYYDKDENRFFIINGNSANIKVFNLSDLSVYNIYIPKWHSSHAQIILHQNKYNNLVELIDSDMKGFIHVWDFHSAECLKTIEIKTVLNGICLWDEQYLICTGRDKEIKIIDLNSQIIIRTLIGHTNETISVRKIYLDKYGECLISYGKDGLIKLWSL